MHREYKTCLGCLEDKLIIGLGYTCPDCFFEVTNGMNIGQCFSVGNDLLTIQGFTNFVEGYDGEPHLNSEKIALLSFQREELFLVDREALQDLQDSIENTMLDLGIWVNHVRTVTKF
jgi:hypothetical protein